MPQIPIEDNFADILTKAQRGLGTSWEHLASAAGVSLVDVQSLLAMQYNDVVARRLARHLHLGPNALSEMALKGYGSFFPKFRAGFAAFNTLHSGMSVNSYLIWDRRSKLAAAIDTGATCDEMLGLLKDEGLKLKYLFVTHNHPDHVACAQEISAHTQADVWMHGADGEIGPLKINTLSGDEFFHIGELAIKVIHLGGHSPGAVAYYVTGLSYPIVFVGDAIFAGSIGKVPADHLSNISKLRKKILSPLPGDTVIASGHGPLTHVGAEKIKNPFFGR